MSNSAPKTIFLVGRAGCGKGTQAALIRTLLGEEQTLYFYTGQKFRELAEGGHTYTTDMLKEKVLERGLLAPRFLAIWAWADKFIRELKPEQHILLDGSPRIALEAEILMQALTFYNREHAVMLHIDIPTSEAITRLTKRGREDDIPEAITKRMEVFEKEMKELRTFVSSHPQMEIVEIDGVGTVEEVFERIRAVLA